MANIGVLLLRVVAGTTVAGLGSRLHRLSRRLGEGREIRRQYRRGDRPSDPAGGRGERRAGPRDWRGPPGPRPSQPVVWA